MAKSIPKIELPPNHYGVTAEHCEQFRESLVAMLYHEDPWVQLGAQKEFNRLVEVLLKRHDAVLAASKPKDDHEDDDPNISPLRRVRFAG